MTVAVILPHYAQEQDTGKLSIHDSPAGERPRERIYHAGERALSTTVGLFLQHHLLPSLVLYDDKYYTLHTYLFSRESTGYNPFSIYGKKPECPGLLHIEN